MDGCFDLIHSGHYNAIRQAKTLGDELIIGMSPDADIMIYKGPPILTSDERAEIMKSCKWVSEV
jgi:ethanolamine-phosphate cytidylyltransferase